MLSCELMNLNYIVEWVTIMNAVIGFKIQLNNKTLSTIMKSFC